MKHLNTVSGLVKDILTEDTKARNTDNYLYLKVLEHYSSLKGMDVNAMTVPALLEELDQCNLCRSFFHFNQPFFNYQEENSMEFFNNAVTVLQTLVVALGAGLGIWGAINLLEGYGNDNRATRS